MKLQVYREFAKTWNASNGLDEVCAATGQTKSAAATLASRMRQLGWKLKKMPTKQVRPLAERFWNKVTKTAQCWIWTGFCGKKGYGYIQPGRRGQKPLQTHRLSWELHNGPIPTRMQVLHHCDNPTCVRPDHLFLGTAADNTHDMMAKERGHWQQNRTGKYSKVPV